MNWLRLRRLFHLAGNLGGLRYEARFRIFELKVPDTDTVRTAIELAPQRKLQDAGVGMKNVMTETEEQCEIPE